jgi:phosphohistidine phosphatase
MPELLLLRHGKSSWDEENVLDFDRPLAERGRRDADAMADLIAADHPPDRILCSPARRARETLAPLLKRLGEGPEVVFEVDLYRRDDGYRDIIAAEGGDSQRLLVVGHNPAIQSTALALIGSGDKDERGRVAAKYPTAALAVIAVEGPWARLKPLAGRLVAFQRPRDAHDGDDGD